MRDLQEGLSFVRLIAYLFVSVDSTATGTHQVPWPREERDCLVLPAGIWIVVVGVARRCCCFIPVLVDVEQPRDRRSQRTESGNFPVK